MWAWVLSGPCHIGHMVRCRVAGVAVGGRDLNWEKIVGLGYHAWPWPLVRTWTGSFQDVEVGSVLILVFVLFVLFGSYT